MNDPLDAALSFLRADPVPDPMQRRIEPQAVYNLAQSGAPAEEIAAFFGMTSEEWGVMLANDTALARLLELAPLAGKAALRHRQFKHAVAGDDKMLKHLGEHSLGQSAKVTHQGDKNNPVQHKITVEFI